MELPPELVQISGGDVEIWGYYNPVKARDVVESVRKITNAQTGKEKKTILHIMSGTHGACNQRIGAVNPQAAERQFYKEDKALRGKQSENVTVEVHEFNTEFLVKTKSLIRIKNPFSSSKYKEDKLAGTTHSMSTLNRKLRLLVEKNTDCKHIFLLAYCCSAGEKLSAP